MIPKQIKRLLDAAKAAGIPDKEVLKLLSSGSTGPLPSDTGGINSPLENILKARKRVVGEGNRRAFDPNRERGLAVIQRTGNGELVPTSSQQSNALATVPGKGQNALALLEEAGPNALATTSLQRSNALATISKVNPSSFLEEATQGAVAVSPWLAGGGNTAASTVAGAEAASGASTISEGAMAALKGVGKGGLGLLGKAGLWGGAALGTYALLNLLYKMTQGRENQATAGAAIDQFGVVDQLQGGQELRVQEGDANRLNALLHGQAHSVALAAQGGLDTRDIELQALLAGSQQQLAGMSSVEPPTLQENLALARFAAGI